MERRDLSYIKEQSSLDTEVLEQLVPYSNKSTRVKQIESLQFFKSQLDFISNNESILDINENYDIKGYQANNDLALKRAAKWACFTFWGLFTYYVVKTPPTRTLYPEIARSMFAGGFVAGNYKLYYNMQYRQCVQKYFDVIIERKMDKSRENLVETETNIE